MRDELLKNKDELIEETFCYLLFENAIFDTRLLHHFIDDATKYFTEIKNDIEIKELLSWVIRYVTQCFISHHDPNDLFIIKNYSPVLDQQWNEIWKPAIFQLINS